MDFAEFLGVAAAAANLPALADSIRTAFRRANSALSSLPGCFQHGDLHPDNACLLGIIDLEESGWAAAGYDVSTAVFEPSLHEGRWRNGTLAAALFTAQQTRPYLELLDEEFRRASVPPPSTNFDAFLICRAISMCAVVHRERAIWERRERSKASLPPTWMTTDCRSSENDRQAAGSSARATTRQRHERAMLARLSGAHEPR